MGLCKKEPAEMRKFWTYHSIPNVKTEEFCSMKVWENVSDSIITFLIPGLEVT